MYCVSLFRYSLHNFLHEFYLKFIINANIVYITVEATFSMSIVCSNRYLSCCYSGWLVHSVSLYVCENKVPTEST